MKHNLRTLNKMIKDKRVTEITRQGKKYNILHICQNGNPVLLFYSEDSNDIAEQIKLRGY